MPHQRTKYAKRTDPRSPLVFDVRALGPGEAKTVSRACPAPANMGAGLVGVPEGAELQLEVQLEGVTEGVLVTAQVTAPLAGECARCLEPFTSTIEVRLQELFELREKALSNAPPQAPGQAAEPDGYQLDGSGLLDLEAALRDALVVELPLSPLCSADCAGLCAECGVRLADAEPGHGHAARGTMWAALKDFKVVEPAAGSGENSTGPDGQPRPGASLHGTDDVPGSEQER